jgi:hypothetical protein
MFFFEKKNQKTFVCLAPRKPKTMRQVMQAQAQKFFASFFQKKKPCFLSYSPAL